MSDEIRPQTRAAIQRVKVTQVRCVVCGQWFQPRNPDGALTCCATHRSRLRYLRERGKPIPYAR